MFKDLQKINSRPLPFEFYTAADLWTDPHIAQQMLTYHLHPDVDAASRNKAFIAESSQWIIEHFNLSQGKKVADFGCGPGLYTTAFAKAGAKVSGIDFSANSIAYAREQARSKGLAINYTEQNYLDFASSDRFDLITMIMCDICALNPAQRAEMLRKFYALLAPGGKVLFDCYSHTAYAERKEAAQYEQNLMDGFWSVSDYFGFLNTFKYDQEKVILDKYTIIEPERIRTIYNWLQYFDPTALVSEIQEFGFSKVELYSDVAGNRYQNESNEFALIIHK